MKRLTRGRRRRRFKHGRPRAEATAHAQDTGPTVSSREDISRHVFSSFPTLMLDVTRMEKMHRGYFTWTKYGLRGSSRQSDDAEVRRRLPVLVVAAVLRYVPSALAELAVRSTRPEQIVS